jgi:hypothetical protein
MEAYHWVGEIITGIIFGEDILGTTAEYLTMNFDRTGEAGKGTDTGETSEIGVLKVDIIKVEQEVGQSIKVEQEVDQSIKVEQYTKVGQKVEQYIKAQAQELNSSPKVKRQANNIEVQEQQ